MPTIKEINENLRFISALKEIVLAYQEIANFKINQIRQKVLKNRQFFQELLKTYEIVARLYKKEMSEKKEEITVFLSAHQPFYGNLILEIWQKVKNFLSEKRRKLVVVGKVGKMMVEESGEFQDFYYFDLDVENIEKEKLSQIVNFLKNYQTIFVFHGKYETITKQIAVREEIGEKLFLEKTEKEEEKYIFEPSLAEIINFFEKEIVGSLFHQTLLEHQLSLNASRVISMYQAGEKAKNEEKKLMRIKNKLKTENINKKILEIVQKR
jgi:F-type H+-transporting ATPase subunit gamma